VEEGYASWYGSECHGKPTASGEVFDMNLMSAAHKTLPLGTHVKVTHLKTGNSIIVRVNDRGPFVAGRIIDLSCKSAQELGAAQSGIAPVRVEAVQVTTGQMIGQNTQWKLEPVPSFRYGQFSVQIGSFREQENVNRLRTRMSKNYRVQVVPVEHGGSSFYRVQVGSYRDLLVAQREQERLRRQGFRDAFVVAVEDK
jgi:rare lipoprotein A